MTIILKIILFIVLAPFLSGLISKIKNNLRLRKGQSIFQPYYNLAKLFSKAEVVSEHASWIFGVTPFIVISSALTAALFINSISGLLLLIFVFALGRFFLALAALDAGSSFGGMGASREMFISSLVEPAFCLVIFSLFLQSGSTNLTVASIVSGIALFLITVAETSRVPVDNQETHLELTMVHEAMVLEYSGRSLALLELASYIKQMILVILVARIIFPVTMPVFAGIIIVAAVVALLEVSVAKMRLFRVADFLGVAFVLGIIAVVCAILGV